MNEDSVQVSSIRPPVGDPGCPQHGLVQDQRPKDLVQRVEAGDKSTTIESGGPMSTWKKGKAEWTPASGRRDD